MGLRKLPEKGTEEWFQIYKLCREGNEGLKEKLARKLGYTTTSSLVRALKNDITEKFAKENEEKLNLSNDNGKFIKSIKEVLEEEEAFENILKHKINPLPKIEARKIHIPDIGSEEAQVVLFSDSQVGIKTRTYNNEVFKRRIKQLTDKILHLASDRRKIHTINKLYLFLLGDLVHGERIGQQIDIDEFEGPAHWQIMDVLVPSFCEMLLTLQPYYDNIYIEGIEGNHGWPGGKFSARGSNWDVFAMELMKAWMSEYKDIHFDIERTSFYKLVEVMGHHFMLVHGDQVPMYNTIPWYGITTRGLRWRGSVEPKMNFAMTVLDEYKNNKIVAEEAITKMLSLPFEYLCVGHFHSLAYIPFNDVTIFMNGTLVTGDEYPLKKIGLGGKAEQWSFCVHKDRITTMDPIYLD